MPLFRKNSSNAKTLAVSPGMYGNESPEQVIFDRTTRIAIERNHWKVATLGLGCIALAAIMKAVGVSADASGKPIVRELEAFQPEGIQLQWAFKDLVTRWFTIEPILTTQVEDSRMARNLRSVREQMIGSSRKQFEDWVTEDEPFRQVGTSATLVREVKVTNIAVLPDSTVAVEFITTTTEDGYKPRADESTQLGCGHCLPSERRQRLIDRAADSRERVGKRPVEIEEQMH